MSSLSPNLSLTAPTDEQIQKTGYRLPEFFEIGKKLGFCPLAWQNSRAVHELESMIEEMPYISEHLSSLRQEIADLRNLNARFTEKGEHNALDQTALELRTSACARSSKNCQRSSTAPTIPRFGGSDPATRSIRPRFPFVLMARVSKRGLFILQT